LKKFDSAEIVLREISTMYEIDWKVTKESPIGTTRLPNDEVHSAVNPTLGKI
jgi:hypothetical protein